MAIHNSFLMRKIGFLVILSMLSVIAHSRAETGEEILAPFKNLTRSPVPVTFTKAIDGTTLLAKDGTVYELPSLLVPDTVEGLSEKTQKELTALVSGKSCTIWLTRKLDTGRVNRIGHSLAEPQCGPEKVWLSGRLVAEGLAIVWPTPANTETTDGLLKLENEARKNKKGLWAEGGFRIETPETVKHRLNSRVIVEGTVYNASLVKNTIFLNFEPEWKEDFTIAISSDLRRDFAKENINLQSLKGKSVRVRGWVREYNGPVIEPETTAQLEILGDQPKAASDPIKQPEPVAGMHSIKAPVAPEVEKVEKPEAPEKPVPLPPENSSGENK